MVEDLIHGAAFCDLAASDNGDMTANLLDDAHFMRDDDSGDAETAIDILDKSEDGIRGAGVESRSRFIAEQDLGIRSKGAGNGNALFLTAGKLRRVRLGAIGQPDQLQKFGGTLAGFYLGSADKLQRKADIFHGSSLHEQVELLKNHAHGATGFTKFLVAKATEIAAFEQNLTAGGALKHIDTAHERRLARAAPADNTVNITLIYIKIYPLKGIYFRIFALEFLFQIADSDNRVRHKKTPH